MHVPAINCWHSWIHVLNNVNGLGIPLINHRRTFYEMVLLIRIPIENGQPLNENLFITCVQVCNIFPYKMSSIAHPIGIIFYLTLINKMELINFAIYRTLYNITTCKQSKLNIKIDYEIHHKTGGTTQTKRNWKKKRPKPERKKFTSIKYVCVCVCSVLRIWKRSSTHQRHMYFTRTGIKLPYSIHIFASVVNQFVSTV